MALTSARHGAVVQATLYLLAGAGLKPRTKALLEIVALDPVQNPLPFEKLVGDLTGRCFRRINIQHRLVYDVFKKLRTVRVLRMWTHYE